MKKMLIGIFIVSVLVIISACRPPEVEGTVLNIKQELYDEAFKSSQLAIEKYPGNAEAWFYWGWLNGEKKQNYAEMNKAFDKALELNAAQKVVYQGANVSVKEAVENYRNGEFAENYNSAVKIIGEAQKLEDEAQKKEQLDKARQKLESAIDFYPSRIEPYRPLSMVYLNLGDTTKAETVISGAVEMFPRNEEILVSAGDIYALMNKEEKSEEILKRVLEVNPQNSAAYQKLGIIESNRDNWTAANDYYQKAMALDPNNADLAYNIGVSFYNQQKFDDAIPYFVKSLETEPENELGYTILAGCYVRSETKMDEGIAFLENAVQKFPQDADMWQFLAILYGKQGMKDKADEAFKKYQELKGEE